MSCCVKELCGIQPSPINQLKAYVIHWKQRAVGSIDATVNIMVVVPTFDW